ncbi:LysE family translocator [Solihabitans fulvus]|uniref:LysE family translocator n=1 Tax=Solihabitans fulvus TaxID=1892852 RepID=A0A5B2XUX7_9PSEU|nr:LysE family translocator [Solihabitans fulvus]KAA2266965.1 LysE family translocator [Solihabitans fulvus]
MVSMDHVLAFGLMSFVLIVVPGPSVLFTVSRALSVGRRAALVTVLGNALGACTQVAAVAFGVGAVVQASAAIFTAVKVVGAGYLVYLGVQAIRHRRGLAESLSATAAPTRTGRVLREGYVVGVTNPKGIVFLSAVLPQFADRSAGQVPLQMLLLGLVFIAIAMTSDTVYAFAAGTAREWLARSPRRLAAIGGTGGLMMIGLGASLAMTGRKD